MVNTIDNTFILFYTGYFNRAAFAGLFGVIIGVAVLRLRGDYLAIVTLAFGEIIKNVLNVLYIGYDKRGIHISAEDAMSLI